MSLLQQRTGCCYICDEFRRRMTFELLKLFVGLVEYCTQFRLKVAMCIIRDANAPGEKNFKVYYLYYLRDLFMYPRLFLGKSLYFYFECQFFTVLVSIAFIQGTTAKNFFLCIHYIGIKNHQQLFFGEVLYLVPNIDCRDTFCFLKLGFVFLK